MCHIEIENLLKNAEVCNDFVKREEYLVKYQKKSDKTKIILIGTLIVTIILYMLMRKSLSFIDSIPFLIAEIVIASLVAGGLIYVNKRLKNKVIKIISTNAPLLCFESEILSAYTKAETYDWENNCTIICYYMRLNNEIKIEITESQYEDIMNKKFSNARIYFFEEILKEYNYDTKVFDVELM